MSSTQGILSQKEFIKRSMISVYGYDTHKKPHIVAPLTYWLHWYYYAISAGLKN